MPPPPPEKPSGRWYQPRWISAAAFVGFAALVLLVALADTRELVATIAHIEPSLLALPFVAALASYVAMSLSYQGIARAAGAPLPFWEMLRITVVANSINYLVATGGLSGFAARLYLFTRRGIPAGTATTISLAQGFITNASFLLFLLFGLIYLIHESGFSEAAVLTTVLLAVVLTLLLLFVVFLFLRDPRRRLIFVMAQASDRFLHRALPRYKPARTAIWRYQRNLNRGIDFLLSRKHHMVMPTFWILLDWVATLWILHAAFLCVQHSVPTSILVLGFAVGIGLSFVSLIPGGLGLMEGSMAAVFTGFDVPFETSVVVVLIFRLAFHVLPLVISVFFFRGLFLESRAQQHLAGSGGGVSTEGPESGPRE